MKSAVLASMLLAISSACASVAERQLVDLNIVEGDVERRIGRSFLDDSAALAHELLKSPLGPDSAVSVALALNPQVREQVAALGISSALLVRAGMLRNPITQVGATFLGSGTELEFGLTQSLFDILARPARIGVASAEIEAARALATREVIHFTFGVRRAWVEARVADLELAALREWLGAEAAGTALARALYIAGNLAASERTLSESALVEAHIQVKRAEARLIETRERLGRMLGLRDGPEDLVLEGEWNDLVSDFSTTDVEGAAVEANLNLRELRWRGAALARAAGAVERAALLEGAGVGIGGKREDGQDGLSLGLSVPLPVFDRGSARRAVAEFAMEAALAQLDRLTIEVRSAARSSSARRSLALARARLAQEEQLPLARRLVFETLREFNAMQIGVFDVLAARRQELRALLGVHDSLREAWYAHLDLEELLAGSLSAAPGQLALAQSFHSQTAAFTEL